MKLNFQQYNHLGFFNPYYFSNEDGLNIHTSFKEALEKRNIENALDIPAVIESLTRRNVFGDRTVIKGINKTPWMAKPNSDLSDWEYFEIPNHDEKIIDQRKIAEKFLNQVKNEVYNYIEGRRNVGILLTGGMDSRIAAGALDLLIKENKVNNIKIVALTWGKSNSRDVIYAKEIADRLNWEWRHYPMVSQDLSDNIEACAKEEVNIHHTICML